MWSGALSASLESLYVGMKSRMNAHCEAYYMASPLLPQLTFHWIYSFICPSWPVRLGNILQCQLLVHLHDWNESSTPEVPGTFYKACE